MARRPKDRGRPDDARRPDFELCVSGRPVSAQAENRMLLQAWKARVAAAASAEWPAGLAPLRGDLEFRMTHHAERRIADRDNLMKPSQDALQGIAYADDRQIKDSTSNWRDINGRFTIRYVSLPLARAFSRGEEFLHIRVWASPDAEDLG